jgi:methionyl-tRNA formyltransferase
MAVLLLSKTTSWCQAAQRFMRINVPELLIVNGERGDQLPEVAKDWEGDYIVSFLSPWIIPQCLLSRARKSAINFHPGPPEYPGIGCYNFALYDEATTYGVTCHHMVAEVDAGPIIKVARFPLFPSDTIDSLKERSMIYLLTLFYEIGSSIVAKSDLPVSRETWKRKPYTRRELNSLCKLMPNMSPDEVRRRVRATSYPGYPGPYIEVGGFRFTL